jgi:catechol 2,3-dioxygenase-like lactoylglutathione lyase family enzyme
MKVQRLGWLGVPTGRFAETRAFFADTLGLTPAHESEDFAMLALPAADHDYVEVIGPAATSDFQRQHYPAGPVVSFVVDDAVAARAELAAAGVEVLDEINWSSSVAGLAWFHFRAPDGNLYGIMQGSHVRAAEDESG